MGFSRQVCSRIEFQDSHKYYPTFSLKVMVNKEKNKVLFAEVDNDFADILLSFLTLPLGRIIKILNNYCEHQNEKLPTIGSLSSLYRSLANLESSHFATEGAKQTLLNPTSLFEYEISLKVASAAAADAFGDGVMTIRKASFVISDDLQILPNETGLLGIVACLGITDAHKAEEIEVELGFDGIMELLKASLTSPTPLSDVILNKTTKLNNAWTPLHGIAAEDFLKSEKLSLKVMIQKSTGKLLYAQAKEDFVEFLFGFFNIPLGGVVHLLAGETRAKAIKNLYRGVSDLADKYFTSPNMKRRLLEPKLVHGCASKNTIFPHAENPLPANYSLAYFSSLKFPLGKGKFVDWPTTFMVTDDLTVTPFCAVSALSCLNSLKVRTHDVQEVEVQIGLKEALSILNASLVSTSALTDALLSRSLYKPPKKELSMIALY